MNAAAGDSHILSELATILALGFRRLQLSRRKGLEPESHSTALCPHMVDANESLTGKERR